MHLCAFDTWPLSQCVRRGLPHFRFPLGPGHSSAGDTSEPSQPLCALQVLVGADGQYSGLQLGPPQEEEEEEEEEAAPLDTLADEDVDAFPHSSAGTLAAACALPGGPLRSTLAPGAPLDTFVFWGVSQGPS